MTAISLPTAAPPVRFHISLNVKDLENSVSFYQILFDQKPAKRRADYAKFETDEPPLVVSLEPSKQSGGGTLNHLGIRLPDARQLVSVQERLERAGIRSQREEGVECCYARQTKFWVHDPDGTLWEFYTLDDDQLEHRGAGQVPEAVTGEAGSEGTAHWEHRLGEEIPVRVNACDESYNEVRLRGSLNVPMSREDRHRFLREAWRMLKPGGRLFLHMLTGEREHSCPQLPGPGAAVRHVPAKDDVVRLVAEEGFRGLRVLKYDDPPCFVYDQIAMRETRIEAFRPAE